MRQAMSSRTFDFESGEIILVDKPYDWTSFDVVNKIRYAVGTKVGHAGTLDPLATGLLIIATGKATKRIEEFLNLDKEYTGIFRVGETTPSFDGETPVDRQFDTSHITLEMINRAAWGFIGEIEQVPPAYSAVLVGGKKSYVLARKGKAVPLGPRKVTIKAFDITSVLMPEVYFRVVCSKGTYMRSLANDFGKALHSGAWLSSLCRTRIGGYKLSDAYGLDEFIDLIRNRRN